MIQTSYTRIVAWSFRVFTFAVLATSSVSLAAECDFADLPQADLDKIDRGELVICTRDVPKAPWPRVFAYVLVSADVVETIGFYSDVDIQKTYVPKITHSVLRLKSALSWEADYKVDVPVVGSEAYTSLIVMSRDAVSGPYRLVWSKVRADSTRAFDGRATISEYSKGRTLIAYENFIRPSQTGSSLFKGRAIQQQKDTVAAIATELERRLVEEPGYLRDRTRWIAERFAMAGSPSSKTDGSPGDSKKKRRKRAKRG